MNKDAKETQNKLEKRKSALEDRFIKLGNDTKISVKK